MYTHTHATHTHTHTHTHTVPEVRFTVTSLEVSENAGSFSIVVSADSVVGDNVLELVSMDGTARSMYNYITPRKKGAYRCNVM